MLVCSLAIAQPAWANKPPVTSKPDYIAITKELTAATDPEEIAKLQFEKYIIEMGESFAECRNLTSVRVKLANFKSPKVKALRSKAFTFGL